MKDLYIECKMGAAGDMLTAALYELLDDDKKKEALNVLNGMELEGVKLSFEKAVRCGIQGTHACVTVNGIEEESVDGEHSDEHTFHEHCEEHADHEHHHHHEHHSMNDIKEIVSRLKLSDDVKKDVLAVYSLIAGAESEVHGTAVDQVHFHEVGSKDAVMDVASVCYLLSLIGADRIIASPVNAGSGTVKCAHGILPVPAPATELLLRGIPYYQGDIQSELCTPTGAALLKYFVSSFGPMPLMKVEKTGTGCGKKDFEKANCVRIFMGTEQSGVNEDGILQLEANVDDMTAEEIGFAMERLFDAGAREAFTSSVYMKKNRPGTLITVICSEDRKDEIVKAFFKHTTTIGIRQKKCERYIMKRSVSTVQTSFGDVRVKESSGYECSRRKLEYDDLAAIALKSGMSLREVRAMIERENND